MFFRTHLKFPKLFLSVVALFLLAGCTAATSPPASFGNESPTVAWQGALEPYVTGTPSATALPPTPLPVLPITPAPTATPFTHSIQKDETLLGIAIRYGITLEELQAANPEVDARMLSIGQVLIIPLISQEAEIVNAPTATAVPVRLSEPVCYPAGDGGLNCFLEAFNDLDDMLESVSVWFGLYDQNEALVSSQVGVLTLNFLPPGGHMPVSVFFTPPMPAEFTLRTQLASSLTVEDEAARYVEMNVSVQQVQIESKGLQANVNGVFEVSAPVSSVWGVALAYDHENRLVGFRRWKQPTGCEGAPSITTTPDLPTATSVACDPLPFAITVFSLGPQIESVEILAEARP